jgi:hypothetical protein
MQPHRVPRKVNVDQGAAALLQVNTLAASFSGHKEADTPGVEGIAGV